MTSTTATQTPTRSNYKGHGRPATFVYYGTGTQAAGQGREIAKVETDPQGFTFKLADGVTAARFGVATKFWAAPVEVVEPTGDTKVIVKAAKAAKAAKRPSRNAKLHDCLCGCRGQVKGLYLQGHDARHASDVAKAALAALAADPDLNLADNNLLDALPTDALKAKAAGIIAKRIK